MAPEHLEPTLAALPREPGVYIMRDEEGRVLYIGKATSLRNRVRSYFTRSGDTRPFVAMLASMVADIEVVATPSEAEALLLEDRLVKEHQPRFNAKLKDDKTFLSIKVFDDHPWPRLGLVRRSERTSGRLFGPYPSATSARKTIRFVNRTFRLRVCGDKMFARRNRPCIQHDMGNCPAPCVLDADRQAYLASLEEAVAFLEGKRRPLLRRLEADMFRAAEAMEFEKAARLRDLIAMLQKSATDQTIDHERGDDADVFGYHGDDEGAVVYLLPLRDGVVSDGFPFHLAVGASSPEEVLSGLVRRIYDGERMPPGRLVTPMPLADADGLEGWLGARADKKVAIHHAMRGYYRRLVEMATKNALVAFTSERSATPSAVDLLADTQEALGLVRPPVTIEGYDVSTLYGESPYISAVTFVGGRPAPEQYRLFKPKRVEGVDDYAMMEEALERRLARGKEEGDLPDLLLIDGGRGHLGVALDVIEALEVDVEVASIAKPRSQTGRDVGTDRIFVPGDSRPLPLEERSPVLRLLQRVRDEAHRFARRANVKARKRIRLTSALDGIEGLGPKRRRTLLKTFGSVEGIKRASLEVLSTAEGIPKPVIERLYAALHADDE